MLYSFNQGTPADRTDDGLGTHAGQYGGIVMVIR
jgi:hypothetical protein